MGKRKHGKNDFVLNRDTRNSMEVTEGHESE
jgi:hypothetical protein